jgi:hypothetical protein
MSNTDLELKALRTLYPAAALHLEGGKPVVFLPDTKFRAAGKSEQMSLLLFASEHSGYATRLFFERKLEGAGASQNWTLHTVLSRKWWAPSWQGVAASLPWISMLGAHVRAVA